MANVLETVLPISRSDAWQSGDIGEINFSEVIFHGNFGPWKAGNYLESLTVNLGYGTVTGSDGRKTTFTITCEEDKKPVDEKPCLYCCEPLRKKHYQNKDGDFCSPQCLKAHETETAFYDNIRQVIELNMAACSPELRKQVYEQSQKSKGF